MPGGVPNVLEYVHEKPNKDAIMVLIKSPPTCSHSITVSTQDFHSCNRSSILLESTIYIVIKVNINN